MEVLQRPGGELATRPIHFFWVVDCSGSMYGEKIGIVNNTIQECIPEMRSAADNNPNAQLLIRALQFSSGASWITSSPVPVEDYGWEDMDANGLTELGKAFDLLAAQLSIPPMPERALPPVIVLLSDGQPTDDYKKSMEKLKKLPWFRKAVKIAISIGQDADDEVLIEFTGNKELVLQANNATALAKMIKWASTTASMVSAPSSKPMNSVVKVYELLGAEVFLYFDVNGTQVTARVDPRTTAKTGDPISFSFDMEKAHFFDKESELVITN